MKIALINTVIDRGGAGRIVSDIHKTIREAGYKSVIFYGRGYQQDDESVVKFGDGLGLLAHGFGSKIFDAQGLLSFRATRRLINQLHEYKPDVVHLHNVHGYYLNFPMLFSYFKEFSIPLVWTLHDCWPFTGHCAHFEYVKCDRWKIGCGNCPQTSEYPSALMDRSRANYERKKSIFNGLPKCRIVAPSQWLKKHVDSSFLSDYQCQVINNGVDLGLFKRNPGSVPFGDIAKKNDNVILGVASIWSVKKGVDIFAKLSHLLDENERLVIVGKMPNRFRRNFSEKTIFLDRIDGVDSLAKLYSSVRVFINPTFEDTFPTTNLEALACGVPVVTFPTGGSPETINFDYGVVCLPTARDALAAARYFYELDVEVVAKECRNYIEKNFDKWDRFQEYIKIYEEFVTDKDLIDG